MFVIHGHNINGLKNAEYICSRCEQIRKPDKIAKPSSSVLQQDSDMLHKIACKHAGEINSAKTGNIISFAAAMQNAEQMRVKRLRQARFHYPMLECE